MHARLHALAALALCASALAPALEAGGMYVESCNLACNSGAGGAAVTGQIVNVFQNQELRVTFSLPVDLASVSGSSFRVVKVADGTMPLGDYRVDLLDPRTLVFTPQLTFDSNGLPLFGFEANAAYSILLPGTGQGDAPPYVRSSSGLDNQSRLEHVVVADQGVLGPIAPTCPTSPNSVGPGARLQLSGTTSIASGSLLMDVDSAPAQVPGVFFAGTEPRHLPLGEGVRCVGGAIRRVAAGTTDAAGTLLRTLDASLLAPSAGETRFLQFWYRDHPSGGAPGSNLSNGISVLFYP